MKLTLKIHRSLRLENEPSEIENVISQGTLIEAIREMVKKYPAVYDLLFDGEKVRSGILYIYKDTELSSMGLLHETIEEDMLIKIVPILHGG